MSLKVYEKHFVNPLLAMSFKDGVDFVEDPQYRASEPKKEGEEWIVLIEHDDDDDDEDAEIIYPPTKISRQAANKEEFETRYKNMKPIEVPTKEGVKITAELENCESSWSTMPYPYDIETMKPCGECLPCSQGGDCLQIINAACASMSFKR